MNEHDFDEMGEYWHELEDEDFLRDEIEKLSRIRRGVLPEGEMALRKTFRLNEPGCSVNCRFCTLGSQYVGSWNKNRIRRAEDIRREISEFREILPEAHIEFVGYWPGISDKNDPELRKLLELIEASTRDFEVIGGDLGIILDENILHELKEAGLTYLHNNLETSPRLYPFAVGKSPERFRRKVRTLQLAQSCGLRTTSGILLGLGENIRDLSELIRQMEGLQLSRVQVNLMDYETDPRIGEIFREVRHHLTPDYALRVLCLLRRFISPNRSLMVGCGVSQYLFDEPYFSWLLQLTDTLHIGAFTNLRGGSNPVRPLLSRLNELGYDIVQPKYFYKESE